MKRLLPLFLLIASWAFHAHTIATAESVVVQTDTTYRFTIIAINTTSTAGQTYGYNIYQKDKLIIHQPHIPAVKGNVGFISKVEAERVALLVIHKLKKGIRPPSVSQRDLQELDIHVTNYSNANKDDVFRQ